MILPCRCFFLFSDCNSQFIGHQLWTAHQPYCWPGTLCHLLLPVSCRGAILRPGSLQFPRWIATIVFGVGYMKSSASDSHFRQHARPLWTTRGPRRLTIYNGPSRCVNKTPCSSSRKSVCCPDLNEYDWTDACAVTLAARISTRFGGSWSLFDTSCRVQVQIWMGCMRIFVPCIFKSAVRYTWNSIPPVK